jgi:hypothetical protein
MRRPMPVGSNLRRKSPNPYRRFAELVDRSSRGPKQASSLQGCDEQRRPERLDRQVMGRERRGDPLGKE